MCVVKDRFTEQYITACTVVLFRVSGNGQNPFLGTYRTRGLISFSHYICMSRESFIVLHQFLVQTLSVIKGYQYLSRKIQLLSVQCCRVKAHSTAVTGKEHLKAVILHRLMSLMK